MPLPFAPHFLAGNEAATALLDDGFRRTDALRAEVLARRERRGPGTGDAGVDRSLRSLRSLLDELAPRAVSPAQRQSLSALAGPGATCVVTGQQLGLFLGPLYTFYKAATCVAWARHISAQTGSPCVPLFWLQTEDHDFPEIASCNVPGLAAPLSLPVVESRCSLAGATLPGEIAALIEQLAAALSPLPHAAEVMALVREAYRPGRRIADAFAALLGALFAGEGLLILDPRCEAVARLSQPLYQTALTQAERIDEALLARGALLERAGFAEQVQVRQGSPLFFFHPEGPLGPRYRLQRAGADAYRSEGGGTFSRDQLLEALHREPLRFSTSALLRPLVQDALLPAVAYVGGPAELGYLAQAAPLYPIFGVRPALAVPRARFRLVDERARAALQKLQLTPAEVEEPREALLQRLIAQRLGAPFAFEQRLVGDLPRLLAAAEAKHPALARAARRTRLTVERAAARFARSHARLLAEADQTLTSRLDKLQAQLYPGGAPQERVFSLPWYAARYGVAALKAKVLEQICPPGPAGVVDVTP